jgi:hypothetical protein
MRKHGWRTPEWKLIVAPDGIEGSGEEALKAQMAIEAAIESWQTGQVIKL